MSVMKKAGLMAAAAMIAAAGAAFAADMDTVLAERSDTMKGLGGGMKILGGMAKGEMAYESARASQILAAMAMQAGKIESLFPAGSGMDVYEKSESSPKIWADWDGFVQKADGLSAALDAAAASQTDQASLGAALGGIGGACKACHENFRVKKN